MRRPALLLFLLLLSASFPTGARDFEERLRLPAARQSAMGGVHAALTDDLYTLIANPAGLQGLEQKLRFTELTMGLSGPIFDITGVILRGVGGEDVNDLLLDPDVQDLLSGLNAGLTITGPISFAYAGGGLGFGVFNWLELDYSSVGASTLATTVAENLLITGGYSFRVPVPESWGGTVDVGGMLKTTIRGEVETTKSLLELVNLFGDPASIRDEPYALILGVGLDIGALYRHEAGFAVGLVARDAFTPTRRSQYASVQAFLDSDDPSARSGRVAPDVSLGFLYTPRILALERTVDRWKFALDYNDIFDFWADPDTARNPILHLGIGAEAVVLENLALRVGLNEGLPSAGLGIDLSAVKVDLSMFGRELSSQPGLNPVYNLIFSVRVER